MHDEERPALEQAPEEDLDLEGAKTTVLSTPYGETTGVRRPPVLSAPTPDDAAGRAPAPAAASADDIVVDVVALTPDYAVSADDAPGSAAPGPDAPAGPVAPAPIAVLADDAPDVLATGEALPGGMRAWAHAALAAGQASGELRADVSPQTAAWLIERTLLGLPEHLMRRLAIDPQEVAASGSVFDTPEVRQVAHEVISMLTAALVVRAQDEGLGPGAAGEADHD